MAKWVDQWKRQLINLKTVGYERNEKRLSTAFKTNHSNTFVVKKETRWHFGSLSRGDEGNEVEGAIHSEAIIGKLLVRSNSTEELTRGDEQLKVTVVEEWLAAGTSHTSRAGLLLDTFTFQQRLTDTVSKQMVIKRELWYNFQD